MLWQRREAERVDSIPRTKEGEEDEQKGFSLEERHVPQPEQRREPGPRLRAATVRKRPSPHLSSPVLSFPPLYKKNTAEEQTELDLLGVPSRAWGSSTDLSSPGRPKIKR